MGALPPAPLVVAAAVPQVQHREGPLRLLEINGGDIDAHAPIGSQDGTPVADDIHLAAGQVARVDTVAGNIHRIAVNLGAGLDGRIPVVEHLQAVHLELVFILARGDRADGGLPDAVGALFHFLDEDLSLAEGQLDHPGLRGLEAERDHSVRADHRRERRLRGLPPPGGGESLRLQGHGHEKGDGSQYLSHKVHV